MSGLPTMWTNRDLGDEDEPMNRDGTTAEQRPDPQWVLGIECLYCGKELVDDSNPFCSARCGANYSPEAA